MNFFVAVKSFDANIAISGNFVLNAKNRNALGTGDLKQFAAFFVTEFKHV